MSTKYKRFKKSEIERWRRGRMFDGESVRRRRWEIRRNKKKMREIAFRVRTLSVERLKNEVVKFRMERWIKRKVESARQYNSDHNISDRIPEPS